MFVYRSASTFSLQKGELGVGNAPFKKNSGFRFSILVTKENETKNERKE
jgi:hypothetical protein